MSPSASSRSGDWHFQATVVDTANDVSAGTVCLLAVVAPHIWQYVDSMPVAPGDTTAPITRLPTIGFAQGLQGRAVWMSGRWHWIRHTGGTR